MKCCDLTATSLNRRIKVLRRTRTADDMGAFKEAWETHSEPFAKIEWVGAGEAARYGRIAETVSARVHIRFVGTAQGAPAITADDRIEYQGRTFGIEGVKDVEDARRWLELTLGAAK